MQIENEDYLIKLSIEKKKCAYKTSLIKYFTIISKKIENFYCRYVMKLSSVFWRK